MWRKQKTETLLLGIQNGTSTLENLTFSLKSFHAPPPCNSDILLIRVSQGNGKHVLMQMLLRECSEKLYLLLVPD